MTKRNDSTLYTGANSSSFRSERANAVATKRSEQLLAKQSQSRKLAPAAELIKTEFAKELKLLMYGPYDNEDNMSDEQFRAERRARRLTVESLLSIQTRVLNMVREPVAQKQPEKWELADEA